MMLTKTLPVVVLASFVDIFYLIVAIIMLFAIELIIDIFFQ